MAEQYEKLFSPIQIGNVTLKNRIIMEPMGVGVAEPDGTPGQRYLDYFEARAKGGAGMVVTEVTRYNDTHGVVAFGQLSMTEDKVIEPFSKVVDAVHKYDCKIFVQLHHPGRQNENAMVTTYPLLKAASKVYPDTFRTFFKLSAGMEMTADEPDAMTKKLNKLMVPVVGPSAIPADLGMSTTKGQHVRALKRWEIKQLVKKHGEAALRAKKAGADGIEVHAAHGYLTGQFLSPYTNQRTDEYGGSFENRFRFLRDLIQSVKDTCGEDYPIIVRLSADEFYETIGYPGRGITLDLGVKIAQEIEKCGVAAIDVTCGNYETFNTLDEPISYPHGWRTPVIKAVKEAVSIPVIAVNVTRTPEQAEALLESGVQDVIGLGRPWLADPNWVEKAHSGREDEILHCISCLNCFVSLVPNGAHCEPTVCALNPTCCREVDFPLEGKKTGGGRTVVVAGAGPSGLTAARLLADRGFHAVVLEKEPIPGGSLELASKPLHKERMHGAVKDLEKLAEVAGAEIHYGVEATAETVLSFDPYAVFVSTGSTSIVPGRIPGVHGENVVTPAEVLNGDVAYENRHVVVVGSGITGLETAQYLVHKGNNIVTVIDMADDIAPGAYVNLKWELLPDLKEHGVNFILGAKLAEIKENAIVYETKDGAQHTLLTDNVVLSLGVRSVNALAEELSDKVMVVKTGDADQPGRLTAAVHSAFKAAYDLP